MIYPSQMRQDRLESGHDSAAHGQLQRARGTEDCVAFRHQAGSTDPIDATIRRI